MTAEPAVGLGPLGRRLLAAFVLVALSSVAVLTVAALVGTDRGLASARAADRERVAQRTAAAAAGAYERAGGWDSADFGRARAIADGAGARLMVVDARSRVVNTSGRGMPGMAGHRQSWTTAPVIVGGRTVGTVNLGFGGHGMSAARGIAWEWIVIAALAALAVALLASWFVTRRLTVPLVNVTRTARAFAGGDRTARTGVTAPGELGQLARAFDGMADEVSWTEESRRHLAANVAHELRTPLAALRAGLEELRDGLSEPAPARLASLHDQALRLGRVVEDLAELSAAESAALSLHPIPVDLGKLARTVLEAHEPQLHAAGIRTRADLAGGTDIMVPADPDRLHQALGNLLANATRYCRPGDMVSVRVRSDRGAGVVEIADSGPGLPADEIPHLFDRLWRGRSSTGVAGSGIGLAVVRELIAAHGGTVQAAAGPAGGLSFTIRLPSAC